MPKDALGIVVAKEDDIDTVDPGDVSAINYKIVQEIAVNRQRVDEAFWMSPAQQLKLDWMTWCHIESAIELTHSRCSIPRFGADHAYDFGAGVVCSSDLVALLQISCKLARAIMHLNSAVTVEAAATVVPTNLLIIEVIHGVGKLLHIFDLIYCLSISLFLLSDNVGTRLLRWLHLVIDIICKVSHFIKHVTAKIF